MAKTLRWSRPAPCVVTSRQNARHRKHLRVLAATVEQVADIHFGDQGGPEFRFALLRQIIGEIEVQMKKEDLILFPAIRKDGTTGMKNPIAVMRADHAGHDPSLPRSAV